ncbi:MAG: anthranilate/aminodeoxychorismate synthase component II [Candidatus Marinimicrobia bacterium]|nr:anthranilate/aminodeoxychorismate synthase component II [Candidatus Neomarinimicrobiota bacterium]|tara:strand:- start:593 stop:1144 length:552 start_codon:yes stop_codon:yes gene_type:complete
MILLIDNYDSFTYNLAQLIESFGETVQVIQNDTNINLDEFLPEKIIISPGPGTPSESGISKQIIQEYMNKQPILGVCLGHQCIGEVFGSTVKSSQRILHGKASLIHHMNSGIFKGIPSPFQAARYHSLSLDSVPENFFKTAWTNDHEIMGIQHEALPLFGVQFHPESFLTPMGPKILENFLNV